MSNNQLASNRHGRTNTFSSDKQAEASRRVVAPFGQKGMLMTPGGPDGQSERAKNTARRAHRRQHWRGEEEEEALEEVSQGHGESTSRKTLRSTCTDRFRDFPMCRDSVRGQSTGAQEEPGGERDA